MPEEINRLVTDSISDYFFVTEPAGVENLRNEGHAVDKIHFVGHVMIDNLFYQLAQLKSLDKSKFGTQALKDSLSEYGVVTLHRPSNVDDPNCLRSLIAALGRVAERLPLIFPVHPRTAGNMQANGIALPKGITATTPLPYMEFLNLWKDARLILTDSGGIQEESTALGIPCVTMRENTERPITVTQGSNVLAGTDPARIIDAAFGILDRPQSTNSNKPPLWDGNAAPRIVECLLDDNR